MKENLKVMVVSDERRGPAATQIISFGQPLKGAPGVELLLEPHNPDRNAIAERVNSAAPDLLVLSRYTWIHGKYWMRYARALGIPLIFHIDDDLLAVPISLGEHKHRIYNSPERLQALRDNIEGVDLVYVSTPALAERFAKHAIQQPIVAGDIYCSVDPAEVGALIPPALGPVFGYMGTGGHSADLAMILPAIIEVLKKRPDTQFELFGTIDMPAELARFGRRVRHLPPVSNYADFAKHLRSLGWWVGLAPLEDNPFNRCKADTKWVEYTTAGFATVASDLPVYHRACADGTGILARTPEEWGTAIEELLFDPVRRQGMVEKAQTKLRTTYTHERLRDQVLQVFETAQRNAALRKSAAPGAAG